MIFKSSYIKVATKIYYLTDKAKMDFYFSNGIKENSMQSLQYSIYSFNSNDADKLLLRINRLSFVESVESIRLGDIYLTNVKTRSFPVSPSKLLKRSRKVIKLTIKYSSTYSGWELIKNENYPKKLQYSLNKYLRLTKKLV